MSTTRLLVGPFNRVEGDLEVRLDVADEQPGQRARLVRLQAHRGHRRARHRQVDREHDDRAHSHFMRQNEVTLEARNIEVLIARCDDKKRIDIRSDKLNSPLVARSGALEKARTIQNALDC